VLRQAGEAVEAEEAPIRSLPGKMADGGTLEHAELERKPFGSLLYGVREEVELGAAVERVRHARHDEVCRGQRCAAL